MARYLWVLIALIGSLGVYEAVALSGGYPTITATVVAFPWWAVVLIAAALIVLAVHFVRARSRRQRAKG